METSVGRIVHYGATTIDQIRYDEPTDSFVTTPGGELVARPGIVTEVTGDTIQVAVFGVIGETPVTPFYDVTFSETLEAGKWTWPPRV